MSRRVIILRLNGPDAQDLLAGRGSFLKQAAELSEQRETCVIIKSLENNATLVEVDARVE